MAGPPLASPGGKQENDVPGWMLSQKGLTRQTARFDPQTLDTLVSQQVMVQPHFLRYWKNPYEFPGFVYSLLDAQEKNAHNSVPITGSNGVTADNNKTGIFDQFVLSEVYTGYKAVLTMDAMPTIEPAKDKPIIKALEELYKECRAPFSNTNTADIETALKDAPPEIQGQVAKLISAAAEAKYYRDRALRNWPKEKRQHAFDYAVRNFTMEDAGAEEEFRDGAIVNLEQGQALDYDDLYNGAGLYLKTLSEVLIFWNNPKREVQTEGVMTPTFVAVDIANVSFEIDTPIGKVSFNSKKEDNTYQGDDYLLIVDMAGNDTYLGGAAASRIDHPVSTVIDWAGNDVYTASQTTPCAQGAGIMGYGFLIDNGGDDTFTAVNNAQGMCYFGVGILWDNGGNDKFIGHASVQGSAAFGVAGLIKIGGNDSYYAYLTSQGFGYVGGYGALIDTAGNDKYVAEPYITEHPEKRGHDAMRNYSFCQGAGWGQRGVFFGGHSMAGGTGVLQDLAGDDWYEAGVFAQASGYFYGTGILHDKSGNDHYEGSVFVQSGTAHMGLTMLLDEAGDDSYHCWHADSQAGAHDFSVSFLLDKGGDNRFSAWEWKDKDGKQTLTNTGVKGSGGGALLGSAINNSIAVFMSMDGNNTYEYYNSSSFGWSNQGQDPASWRYKEFNLGLFLDISGNDTFNVLAEKDTPDTYGTVRLNSWWSRTPEKNGNKNKNFSIGINAPAGKVPEAER